jgi:thiosulfate/3-mercaptopyruvate sulfurtransferase
MPQIQPIVSPEWLASQLDNPQVAVVDCRFRLGNPDWGCQQYRESHIAGARYLDLDKDLSAPVQRHGGRHPLPEPEELAQKLAAIGITAGETLVVAYDDSRFAFAARLWWLLRYLGHEAVAVLDGGWAGWEAKGYPVTAAIPKPKPGNFRPKLQESWIVSIEQVKTCQDSPSVLLLDSREEERYRGEREPIDPVAGHIPGAVNFPWTRVTDGQGCLKAGQAELWADLPETAEIIAYCGSGVTACVNLLSLELAGIDKAKLYPGGWSDWCSYLT